MDRFLDSHLDKKTIIYPRDSLISIMRVFLFVHIFIVSFQIPFRSIILDTTYIRDILPIVTVFLLVGIIAISSSSRIKHRYSLLEKLCFFYLIYGMIMILIWLSSGVSLIAAIRDFRNHFFPVVLFPWCLQF